MADECVPQAEQSKHHIDEVMVCRLLALMSKEWPEEAWAGKPKLLIVGKPAAERPTPVETFHNASLSIVEFARRWQKASVSQSEVKDADVLLLGLRRLLADARAMA